MFVNFIFARLKILRFIIIVKIMYLTLIQLYFCGRQKAESLQMVRNEKSSYEFAMQFMNVPVTKHHSNCIIFFNKPVPSD